MRKTTKICLITALALIALGLIIFAVIMQKYEWDFTRLSTVKYEANTYVINENFDNISINTDTTDIVFALSDDGKCRVDCYEEEKVKYRTSVKDGTLVIDIEDTRKWYDHIGIFLGSEKMTVHLPLETYSSLLIDNDTGDIELPQNITFGEIKIYTDTGDVNCFSSDSKKVKIDTATGDVILEGGYGDVNVSTATGKIKFNNVKCMTLIAESDTGDISFDRVMAITSLDVESDTGDITFEESDAGEIKVKTSTGDVEGSLLTDKIFFTETSTGGISVPKTTSGGKCEITTSTGDINIDVN